MIDRTGAGGTDWPAPTGEAREQRRWADLLPRVASGLVMVALALVTARAGGPVFLLFWLVAALAVSWEWQRLVGQPREPGRVAVGLVGLAVSAAFLTAGHVGPAVAAVAVAGLGTGAVATAEGRVTAAAGPLYAGALLLSVVVLRSSRTDGLEAVLWLFAVVWGTDVLAYFGGRLIGGPKLWRSVSPAKTWSGLIIGVTAGALAGLLARPAGFPAQPCFLIGLAAGAASQGGDLFESWFKRRRGVKDASRLIPGHGGAMDRLDGFIAAAVFAACLGVAHSGLDAAGAGLFTW